MRQTSHRLLPVVVLFVLVTVGPSAVMAYMMVTEGGCKECHSAVPGSTNDFDLHTIHATLGCSTCHDGTPGEGTVFSSVCAGCHPFAVSGQCPLVNEHDPSRGASCLVCHPSCEEDQNPGDGTTTTSVATRPCLAVEIYGEGSEEVELLRCFRDTMLSRTQSGRKLIAAYYALSPAITEAVRTNATMRSVARAQISAFVRLLMLIETH